MKLTRVILTSRSGIEATDLGSHKLSRAILYAINAIYGSEGINKVKSESFVTTDLLPWSYSAKNEKIFFVPMPQMHFEVEQAWRKTFKKIQFASEKTIEKIAKIADNNIDFNIFKIKGKLLCLKDEDPIIQIYEVKRPHNALYRVKKREEAGDKVNLVQTEHFFYSQVKMIKEGGLYFDFYTETEETRKMVIAAVRYLEDQGIGKNISKGVGQIKIEKITTKELGQLTKNNVGILLSSWKPKEEEIKENIVPISYNILTFQPVQRTKEEAPKPLAEVKLISSGSIILNASSNVIGEYVDIGEKDLPNLVWGKALIMKGPEKTKVLNTLRGD
ncbi:MAG: type III-A CRISPR-associated RAMP protein Csm4 [Candidatus Heimdallarchaeaceae archaeon]